MKLEKELLHHLKLNVLALLIVVLFIAAFALLAGCSAPPVKTLPAEIKTVTVERCYEYRDFSPDQWDEAIMWLQSEPDQSVPALMVEDYVRLRLINECEDKDE